MKPYAVILLLAAAVAAEIAMARPPGPPPEAVEACANQTEGAQCSFSGRRGDELTGQCSTTPKGEMACMPEGGPPERGGDNQGRPERPPRSE